VIIPFFLSMFASFHTLPLVARIIMFIIPFSHPMMAVGALMFNDYLLVISGIIYVTLFAVLTIALVSYVFSGDTLLTGRFEVKWLQKVLKIFKK